MLRFDIAEVQGCLHMQNVLAAKEASIFTENALGNLLKNFT